jgi:hypothetical protein
LVFDFGKPFASMLEMFNGGFVSKCSSSRKQAVPMNKIRVKTWWQDVLPPPRPQQPRLEVMFEIVHAVQKVTGVC